VRRSLVYVGRWMILSGVLWAVVLICEMVRWYCGDWGRFLESGIVQDVMGAE